LVVLLPAGLSFFDILLLTGWMVGGVLLLRGHVNRAVPAVPAFSEKPMEVLGNAVLMMALSFLPCHLQFRILRGGRGAVRPADIERGLGSSFLLLGWRKLTRLE
jgi:hypothetical protein